MVGSWKQEQNGVLKIQTCAWSPPGDHPVGCGLILTVEDGKVVKVEGDPTHPISQGRLCPRCLALDEYMYHPDRVIYPMKRAREDRGKDKWEQITWDEALDLIDEKVTYIKEQWGAESICVFQGTGREATLYAPPLASAVLGTPNSASSLSGLSCYGPRCSVADFILGAGYPELDYAQYFADRYDDPRYEVPKYIILWGKDPLYSNPDGFFGHAIIDLMKRGSKFITIDPRLTWVGVRSEYHLQLRPGTDAAVGLGLINVVISEELYDHDFVENWCYGFDELAERASEYTPEKVEEIAWVPAEKLIGAARAFATNSPSSIMWGVALDMAQNGVQGGHTILDLAAICGYFDIPGGITLAVPASFMGKWRYECSQMLPPELWAKRLCEEKYIGYRSTATQSHPDSVFNAMRSGKPYPLKMAWFFGTNPISCMAMEPQNWYEEFLKLEFNVVQDCFMTPTAMGVCDLFLPLTTFAEHDGVVLPHFGRNTHFIGAMNKAVEVGDCKSDIEVLMWLGARLNPEAWQWPDAKDFFTDQIRAVEDLTFEELREMGTQIQPFEYRKYEKGLLRPDGQPGFNTPTGLIELSSSLYEDWNEDPLPYFREPHFSPYSDEIDDEQKEKYPLVLTTGGRNLLFFHSEHRQICSLRSLTPDPLVTIHPRTAAKYGIKDGDWVRMENELGHATMKALVSPVVDERVVHAQHAWWYPEQDGEAPNLFGNWKSNINTLMDNNRIGIIGYGANYKSTICSICKVDSLES